LLAILVFFVKQNMPSSCVSAFFMTVFERLIVVVIEDLGP